MKVKTAVFPVAGLGSRFLPITKSMPKEMLPIIDKPIIHFAVEEALSAGIRQLIFVTSYTKRSIEDYFDSHFELETRLAERGKHESLGLIKNILPEDAQCVYVRQPYPLGLGDAVLRAKNIIGDQPFAVILSDDIVDSDNEKSCLTKMIEQYDQTQSSVLALEEVAPTDVDKYGIAEMSVESRITSLIEKPAIGSVSSTKAISGRYVLTPRIFELLENTSFGRGGEIQLTDAIAALLKEEKVYGYTLQSRRYDCGSKAGYLKAIIDYALKDKELKKILEASLENMEV